jgi:iron complex outermembrane receptor protein
MARKTVRTILTTGVCTVAIAMALLSSVEKTRAQQATLLDAQSFSVPAQPLSRSLTALAKTYGIRLVYQSDLTRNLRGAAFAGTYTTEQALNKLLAGTSLTYRVTSERTIAVFDRAAIDAHAQNVDLTTITVEGTGDKGNATIGNLPAPYAGGDVARGSQLGILGNVDIMSTPFNTTSFTDQFKTNVDALSLSDVLRYSPSIVAAASGPNAITDAMYIRGFWGGAVMYDGLAGLEFRQSQLEPIERVELLLGPSAFLYGQPASVGGSINLVPKRATDAPITTVGTRYISRQNLGVFTDVGRRYGDHKEFGIRVNGAYSYGETEYKDVVDRRMGLQSLALDYKLERFRWTFDFTNHDRKAPAESWFDLDAGVPVPDPKRAARQFMPKWAYYDASYQLAMSRFEVDLNDQWTASAAYGRSWLNDFRFTQVSTITDAAGTLDPIYYGAQKYRGKTVNDTAEAVLRGDVNTGPARHRLRIGYSQLGNESRWAGNYVGGSAATNIYNPTFPPEPSINDPQTPGYPLAKSTTKTFFASDQIGFLDDRLQFIVGARQVQYHSRDYDATTGAQSGSYKETALTPAYAVVVRPFHWLSLYANHVEALEPGYQVDPTGTAANAGEFLKPAHTKQNEVGAKVDFGKIGLTTALFQIERPSIYRDPVSNIEGYNGQQVNKGFEITVYGEPLPGFRVLGGATFLDPRLTKTFNGTNDGNRPSDVPLITVVGHFDWDIPGVHGLAWRFGFLHTGSVYADFDQSNTQRVPSWTRFDTGLRYKTKVAQNDLTLRFNIDNLFDERYFQVERQTLYSGAGRTYILSATMNFN